MGVIYDADGDPLLDSGSYGSGTFGTMKTRIATELRRSNMTSNIEDAINDAIIEAATDRFFFNEMRGPSFDTVIGQEYYPDLHLTEIDAFWFVNGSARWDLLARNNNEMNEQALGVVVSGLPTDFSRYGESFRLYPIPSTVITMNVEGYGRLTPWPLTDDNDTNAWMIEGERYVRAIAKRILLQDVIRDFGEAAVQGAMAEDQRIQLVERTTLRSGTGTLYPTQF